LFFDDLKGLIGHIDRFLYIRFGMRRAQKHVVMPEEVNAAQRAFPAEELGALEVAFIGKTK